MRLGVFGGTFDPVHMAHLIIAERVRDTLQLDRVLFVPCAIPPHKPDRSRAADEHRFRMIELAISGNPFFRVSDLELKRGGLSYTVDTLRRLTTEASLDRERLFLIMGADNLKDLHTWREPKAILELCRLVVVARPHVEIAIPDFGDVIRVDSPLLEISSSRLRAMVQAGQSIRYLVAPKVRHYISAHKLYEG